MNRPLLYSAPMATPGPWSCDAQGRVSGPRGQHVATVHGDVCGELIHGEAETAANGAVLAAAPALYVAALNAVLTLKHARTCVNPSEYAHALDWHRLESDLAAALRSAGADLPPVPPRMAP